MLLYYGIIFVSLKFILALERHTTDEGVLNVYYNKSNNNRWKRNTINSEVFDQPSKFEATKDFQHKSKTNIVSQYSYNVQLDECLRTKEEQVRFKISLEKCNEELNKKEGQIIQLNKLQEYQRCTNESFDEIAKLREQITILKDKLIDTLDQNQKGDRKAKRVVYAINCAGNAHIDSNGIYYVKDPLSPPGWVHNWFQTENIARVHPQDYDLYRSVRFLNTTFGYNIPIKTDGNYVLVLKFTDDLTQSNQRVFDVNFNKLHNVLKNFDIIARASRRTAYDEYVPFTVKNKHVIYKGATSVINNNVIQIEFVPKKFYALIAAIYVIKGDLEDVPQLPAIYYPNPDV